MNILLRSALFFALLLSFGCSGDDDPAIPPIPLNCTITPSGLNYGQVALGKTLDMSFTITNSSSDSLFGTVSETCPYFSIKSGDGAYALAPTESRMVTVTFAPTVRGTRTCIAGTGNSECGDVSLTGVGIVLSKILDASLDNTLYEDTLGVISNGIGQWMFVGVTKGFQPGNPDPPEKRRAVFKFDIASAGIPVGSTIDSVFLTLYMINPPSGLNGPQWQDLHLLTTSWGEGPSMPLNPNEGGGAPAETNDATWLHRFFPATLWAQPGGEGDYASTKSSNLRVGDVNGPKTWGSTARMVSDVELWISAPASNHGWILIDDDESIPQTAKRFATRQRSVPSERPTLVIYYSEP